jgi:hypothetical protein
MVSPDKPSMVLVVLMVFVVKFFENRAFSPAAVTFVDDSVISLISL